MKTTTKKNFEEIVNDLTMAQAAEITGYSAQWLRQLAKDGFYPRKPNGNVTLSSVIRGIERSITGWKPPGYDAYRR